MIRGFLGNSNFFIVGTRCFDVVTVMYLSKTAEHITPRLRCIAGHVSNYVALGVLQVLLVTNISYLK